MFSWGVKMSKKDGILFSSALFGYKKSDVNDYIKRTDINHSDQLSLLQAENDRLLERAQKAEGRVEELEKMLAQKDAQIEAVSRERDISLKRALEKEEADSVASSFTRKRRGMFGVFKKK